MLTSSIPIESQFANGLVDHLNAEIVLGTVSNVKEGSTWLSYTYMHVRSVKNPLTYGISWEAVMEDRHLEEHRRDLIVRTAKELNRCRMARFDERSGQLYVTELGRVASHFYIHHESIQLFDEALHSGMKTAEILALLSESSEFENMMVREEEIKELEQLLRVCPFKVKSGVEQPSGKVNVLIQAFVSRFTVEAFSLVADMMYVSQNAPRICRALFEICLRRGWSSIASVLLELCKSFEKQIWPHHHPLRQFKGHLPDSLIHKLENKEIWMDALFELETSEIQRLLNHPSAGILIRECLDAFPVIDLNAQMQPITRTVVQVRLELKPLFRWQVCLLVLPLW